jgi:hypothetical protein
MVVHRSKGTSTRFMMLASLITNNSQYLGPFKSPQMAAWCKAGYFSMDLQLRRVQDTGHLSLKTLIEQNNDTVPFVVAPKEKATKADKTKAKVCSLCSVYLYVFALSSNKRTIVITLLYSDKRRLDYLYIYIHFIFHS